MSVADLLETADRTIVGIEIFPPREGESASTMFGEEGPGLVEAMYGLRNHIDLVSVTCPSSHQADWRRRPENTLGLDLALGGALAGIEVLWHVVGAGWKSADVLARLRRCRVRGRGNVLALKGDGTAHANARFRTGADVVRAAAEMGLRPGAACDPNNPSWPDELAAVRAKVDAGAEYLISQAFWKNSVFFAYVSGLRKAGIHIPVVAGLLPALSVRRIERMATLANVPTPIALLRRMAASDNPAAVGMEHTHKQVEGLLAAGVEGIHVFTMNRITELLPLLSRLGTAKALSQQPSHLTTETQQ